MMNAIKSTPFSFLAAKEFDALEGFVWLYLHGDNSFMQQTFLISMMRKLIFPLEYTSAVHLEYHIRAERERRTYPNGKPPLLTE